VEAREKPWFAEMQPQFHVYGCLGRGRFSSGFGKFFVIF